MTFLCLNKEILILIFNVIGAIVRYHLSRGLFEKGISIQIVRVESHKTTVDGSTPNLAQRVSPPT